MGWISVNDEMPKESQVDFLGVCASEKVLVVIEFEEGTDISVEQTINGKWDIETKHDVKVTHWMHFPDLPK